MADPRRKSKVDEAGEWWALSARILAFFFGAVFIWTNLDSTAQPTEVLVAKLVFGAACMGPTIAANIATIIAAWRKDQE